MTTQLLWLWMLEQSTDLRILRFKNQYLVVSQYLLRTRTLKRLIPMVNLQVVQRRKRGANLEKVLEKQNQNFQVEGQNL